MRRPVNPAKRAAPIVINSKTAFLGTFKPRQQRLFHAFTEFEASNGLLQRGGLKLGRTSLARIGRKWRVGERSAENWRYYGRKPKSVHSVREAADRGWLNLTQRDALFRVFNELSGYVYYSGSFSGVNAPQTLFSLSRPLAKRRVLPLLAKLGLTQRNGKVRVERANNPREYTAVYVNDAVFARCLAAMGVPRGKAAAHAATRSAVLPHVAALASTAKGRRSANAVLVRDYASALFDSRARVNYFSRAPVLEVRMPLVRTMNARAAAGYALPLKLVLDALGGVGGGKSAGFSIVTYKGPKKSGLKRVRNRWLAPTLELKGVDLARFAAAERRLFELAPKQFRKS